MMLSKLRGLTCRVPGVGRALGRSGIPAAAIAPLHRRFLSTAAPAAPTPADEAFYPTDPGNASLSQWLEEFLVETKGSTKDSLAAVTGFIADAGTTTDAEKIKEAAVKHFPKLNEKFHAVLAEEIAKLKSGKPAPGNFKVWDDFKRKAMEVEVDQNFPNASKDEKAKILHKKEIIDAFLHDRSLITTLPIEVVQELIDNFKQPQKVIDLSERDDVVEVHYGGWPQGFGTKPDSFPETEEEKKTLIAEYGVWPTLGFAALIALSKEWVVIDDELLLASQLIACLFAFWVGIRGQVVDAYNRRREIRAASVDAAYDSKLNEIAGFVDRQASLQELPDAVKRVEEYRYSLEKELITARLKKSRYDRAKATSERLERIVAFEEDLKKREAALIAAILSKKAEREAFSKFGGATGFIQALNNPDALKSIRDGLDQIVQNIKKEISDVNNLPESIKKDFPSEIADYQRARSFFDKLVTKKL